jgi:hypothetical protein
MTLENISFKIDELKFTVSNENRISWEEMEL